LPEAQYNGLINGLQEVGFKEDESNHKNIANEAGATNEGLYSIMDKIIKTSSKIAITVSEKI